MISMCREYGNVISAFLKREEKRRCMITYIHMNKKVGCMITYIHMNKKVGCMITYIHMNKKVIWFKDHRTNNVLRTSI